jgi:hypothetical protein
MRYGKCVEVDVRLRLCCDYGALALLIRSTELLIISTNVRYRPKRTLRGDVFLS